MKKRHHTIERLQSGLLAVFVTCLLLPSCMHKDVMSDPADDVKETIVYSGKEGSFIITQETIFQATSKSSGSGISHTSGYNESRLTTYDISTGAILSRVELGEEMETSCDIIHVSDGELWMYSIDPELGLHCRNPKTLEVVTKESDIKALKGFDFSRPEWSAIKNFYAYDFDKEHIVVTDMQGNHFIIDPKKSVLEKTEDDMPKEDWNPDCFDGNAYFDKDTYAAFDGSDDRKKVIWYTEKETGELSFLKPEYFVDLNPIRVAQRKRDYLEGLSATRDSIQLLINAIIKAHPVFDTEEYIPYDKFTREELDLRSNFSTLKRDLQSIIDEIKHEETFSYNYNRYSLFDKTQGCMVYSASNVSDTARAIITCIDCNSKKFTQRWQLKLPAFYFNPSEAEGAGVFDEGNPEFGYRWADIHDGKFLMIAQLRMICVEMKSGKLLWEITL